MARIDGQDYGPGDHVADGSLIGRLVAVLVAQWARQSERSAEERQAAQKFLGSWT